MKFIKKWSYICAKKLAAVLNETHRMKSIYYYSFQIVIGAIVKCILLMMISLLLNILRPTLVCTLVFVLLRIFAGGCHMDTYGKCIILSLVQFSGAGMIAEYTYIYWNRACLIVLIIISFLTGLYIIIRYAPKDTKNKPITDQKQKKRFKKLSLIYLFIWLTVTLALAILNGQLYAIASCLGVLLELFTISPVGHKFYYRIRDRHK